MQLSYQYPNPQEGPHPSAFGIFPLQRRGKTQLTGEFRVYILIFFFVLISGVVCAQEQQPDTLDYSYLKFEDLHDYYTSMSVNIIEAEDPNLYFETYAWLGTPYHWGGKSHAGLDCSGFVAKVYNRLYGTGLSGAVSDIFKQCEEILPSELKEGDFVFFNINGHYLYHMGIYLQNGKFAHAAVHGGVMVSSMDEAYYKRWFYKAGRLKQATGD
ncbi:MAG: cell wall-associated hydrolase, invasion-associated protein [Bacteroidetes bacterium]|nr:cell wall-associated hydrolase, invasion-associated protein [Bacteroidota bacterium]